MSIFSKKFLTAATAAVVLSLTGCGDSGGGGAGPAAPGGVTPQAAGQLPGTWTFKAVSYTPRNQEGAQPIVREVQGTLTFAATTFDMDRTENGQNNKVKGTYKVEADVIKAKSDAQGAQEGSMKYRIEQKDGKETLFIESQVESEGVTYDSTDILSRDVPGTGQQPAAPTPTPTPTPGPMP